jgi:hypothetical protein
MDLNWLSLPLQIALGMALASVFEHILHVIGIG